MSALERHPIDIVRVAIGLVIVAGFASLGIASGPVVAGVLSFRLLTFWLPIIPGYLALRSLAKRELW